jgi:L-ascorbate metabolism protein UlaG (beta-lactamase superfamily)
MPACRGPRTLTIVQITRFGHAAVLVQVAGRRVLVDPGVFCGSDVFELEGLDAIVVTHQHRDHLDVDRVDALLALNPDAILLSDPETAKQVDRFNAHTDGDVTAIGDVTLTGAGTTHAEILPSIPRVANTGVLVRAPGEPTFFHPGDSYATAPAQVDILAAPLWAPWAKVSETVDFVQRVAPRVAFPIHDAGVAPVAYGIYWGHLATHGGVADARQLGPSDSASFE